MRPLKRMAHLNLAALHACKTTFCGLDMRCVKLQGAQLESADLRDAKLSGANFFSAILRDCNMGPLVIAE